MTSARIDRREQMAQQPRGDILRAARRLFAERGYAATSINDIAEEAGVAIQTIYARLGSKRGLLLALIDLIDEEAGVGPLAEEVTSAAKPLAARFAAVRSPVPGYGVDAPGAWIVICVAGTALAAGVAPAAGLAVAPVTGTAVLTSTVSPGLRSLRLPRTTLVI